MLNPTRDTKEGKYRGGGEGKDTYDHRGRFVQEAVEGKTSHGLTWKLKMTTKA